MQGYIIGFTIKLMLDYNKRKVMKVKLLRKIRKECEKGYGIVICPGGYYRLIHNDCTEADFLTKEEVVEKYRRYVYSDMEYKIRKLRYKNYNKRRIRFSLWK